MKKLKKSLLKNNLKTIKKTRRRFISILIMAFLGVGFFAGLVASSPDMLDSLDNYADNNNLYDISILSTLGFTDEDIEKIGEIEGIENVYGVQTKDSLTKIDVLPLSVDMYIGVSIIPTISNSLILKVGLSSALVSVFSKTIFFPI